MTAAVLMNRKKVGKTMDFNLSGMELITLHGIKIVDKAHAELFKGDDY